MEPNDVLDPEVVASEMEATAGATGIAAEEAAARSLLQKADDRRKERSDHLYLDIPSWDGDLIGEYNPVGRKDLEAMVRKSMQEAKRSGGAASNSRTQADVNIIVRACCGLWVRDEGEEGTNTLSVAGGSLVRALPLMAHGMPATFSTMNEVLKKPDVSSALDMVLYLFGGHKPGGDPSLPISAHALTIARYMRDPSKDPLEGLG